MQSTDLFFPSSEIYDGLSAVYDYAQNGVELKRTYEYWWKAMVQLNDNIVGLDVNINASDNLESFWPRGCFNDPLIDDLKRRYRADVLLKIMLKSLIKQLKRLKRQKFVL
jgi:glycyl-tRNA synthetase